MPLQDSFGKKATKSQPDAQKPGRARNLSHVPMIDDLMAAMNEAQETVRQPVILTWKRGNQAPVYLLTVIRNSKELEPTWMLHADDKDNVTVLWSYSTTDTELIRNLITEQILESGPAAVIPDSLRRKEGTEEDASSQPQFFENYEIINTIGHGGMGIIYKAHDRADGSFVALKVLRADLMVDPSNVERFKHEASAVRSLKHQNLIALREFGVSRFGQPFLAMDYIEGVELRDTLQKAGRLDTPQFINVFTQICEALAYAHEQGLVHRDLKPGNIMLVKTDGGPDMVKIIDFGIAKSVHENSGTSSITTFGHFLGSPAYMSPEQCGGAVLDSRSDIYSLGCVMYESLTGSLPFQHDNILKIIFAQVNDNAAPFANVRPELGIPLALEEIIFKCLNKNPHDRYQSARELCEELWEFAASGKATKARLSATQQVKALRTTVPEKPSVADGGPTQLNEDMVRLALSSDRMPAFKPNPPAQNVPLSQVQSAPNMPAFIPSPPAHNVAPSQVQSAPNMPAFNPSPPAQNVPLSQVQSAPNMPVFKPGNAPPAPPPSAVKLARALNDSSAQAASVPAGQPDSLHTTGNPIGAPDVVPSTKAAEESALSGLALRLLTSSGVISEDLLRVVADCVQTIENGDITLEQAVSIIRHATGKHKIE